LSGAIVGAPVDLAGAAVCVELVRRSADGETFSNVRPPDGERPTRAEMQERIEELEHQQSVDRELIAHLEDEGVIDRDKIANLEVALITCRRIGSAIGILMARNQWTEEAAFAALRTLSQRTHRKIRDIADDVLFTGTFDVT
jgi:hypothetical protein